jgi:hypothetical protein
MCLKNKGNGAKGGRPSKKPKKPTGLNGNPNNPTEPDSDSDNDIDIEKEKNIIPPSLDLVIKYCSERKNKIDPQYFIDWYSTRGWKVGKDKMKDWWHKGYDYAKNKSELMSDNLP